MQTLGSAASVLIATQACPFPRSVAIRVSDGALFVACQSGGVLRLSTNGSLVTLANSSQCSNALGVIVREWDGAAIAACQNGVVELADKPDGRARTVRARCCAAAAPGAAPKPCAWSCSGA